MKKILLIMVLLLVSSAYSVIETTDNFFGQTNPFNITFAGQGNFTYHLEIPRYADIQNITLRLTGLLSELIAPINVLFENNEITGNTQAISGNTQYAQTFTIGTTKPDNNYNITRIDLNLWRFREPVNNITVAIQLMNVSNSKPDGVNLTQISFNGTELVTDLVVGEDYNNWVTLYVPTITLNASTSYALVFSGNNLGDGGHYVAVISTVANSYNGGSLYRSTDGGNSWSAYTSGDVAFRLYGNATVQNVSETTLNISNYENEWDYSGEFVTSQNVSLNITRLNDILTENCSCYDCVKDDANCRIPFNYYSNSSGVLNVEILNSSYEFGVDNCSSYSYPILNFSFFDENNLGNIFVNASGLVTANFFDDGQANMTIQTNNIDSLQICRNTNITYPFYADVYIQDTGNGGLTQRYYLNNESVTDALRYWNIYNFNTPDSTLSDLKITIRDISTYNYMTDITAHLQRFYLGENIWRTVQMDKSGDYGLVFFNIYEEDTDYRLIYKDNSNNILKTTQSLKFVCTAGVCDLTQQLNPYSATTPSTDPRLVWGYNNDTGIINITWDVATGDSTTIRSIVTKETITGTLNICDTTSTGAAGIISCNVSGYSGTIILQVLQGTESHTTAYLDTSTDQLSNMIPTLDGALWTFAIMVTIIMFGLFSPVGVVITTIIGLVLISYMGIFSPITVTVVIIAAVLGIAIGIKVRT